MKSTSLILEYQVLSFWDNNVGATHNVLCGIVESGLDIHLVHLGTMGVYGYSTVGAAIPEGYLPVDITTNSGDKVSQEILYPSNPGSIYHMTKCLDQLLFAFYAKNDGLRITDLHQGIVWGTQTEETKKDERLINRFDYDGDYGTVLNRFLMQAAVGYPMTVHGTGGQTRAFIHIQDSVRCIELALNNPPEKNARVEIFNQMTETHRVRDLAKMISDMSGVEIAWLLAVYTAAAFATMIAMATLLMHWENRREAQRRQPHRQPRRVAVEIGYRQLKCLDPGFSLAHWI